MKKIHIIIVLALLIAAVAGFYVYTRSGGSINEEPPQIISKEVQKILEAQSQQNGSESTLPSVPTGEQMNGILPESDTKKLIDEMSQMTETVQNELMPVVKKDQIRQGSFVAVDFIHKASGLAKIFSDTTEGPILRLEDFTVTNGPDLYVYLSQNTTIEKNGLGEFVELQSLKASSGNQNYRLPDNYDDFKTVVIWCRKFSVLFSYAELTQ